jgi:3'-phosphoadenosine 5'-phosphosulfate (PAPS) 3'-phosphatase
MKELLKPLLALVPNVRSIIRRELRSKSYEASRKEDGSWVTTVDIAVSEYLKENLPLLVKAPVISEEDIPPLDVRLSNKVVWIVDPIDNTASLVEGKWRNSSINIGLVVNGVTQVGLVHYLGSNTTYLGSLEGKVYRRENNKTFILKNDQAITASPKIVAYKASLDEIPNTDYQEQIKKFGGDSPTIVHKRKFPERIRALLDGEADIYIEPRGIKEWDIVHAAALVTAMGGAFLDLETLKPVTLNSVDLVAPPFVAVRDKGFLLNLD